VGVASHPGSTKDRHHVARNNRSICNLDVTANNHRVAVDSSQGSELEIGTDDHDVTGHGLIDLELREHRGTTGGECGGPGYREHECEKKGSAEPALLTTARHEAREMS
jgi:hypothetical protein